MTLHKNVGICMYVFGRKVLVKAKQLAKMRKINVVTFFWQIIILNFFCAKFCNLKFELQVLSNYFDFTTNNWIHLWCHNDQKLLKIHVNKFLISSFYSRFFLQFLWLLWKGTYCWWLRDYTIKPSAGFSESSRCFSEGSGMWPE